MLRNADQREVYVTCWGNEEESTWKVSVTCWNTKEKSIVRSEDGWICECLDGSVLWWSVHLGEDFLWKSLFDSGFLICQSLFLCEVRNRTKMDRLTGIK